MRRGANCRRRLGRLTKRIRDIRCVRQLKVPDTFSSIERKYEMIALHLKNRATSALRGASPAPIG